jgi:hypothetical protein
MDITSILMHSDAAKQEGSLPCEEKGHCSTNDSFHSLEDLIAKPQQLEKSEEEPECKSDLKFENKSKTIIKHRKLISKCGHDSENYYANGMCKNCYHQKGRTKRASACEHTERCLYAKGLCKNCYLSVYHKQKRTAKRSTNKNEDSFV